MAHHAPKKCALRIIAVFRKMNGATGGKLNYNSFAAYFEPPVWSTDDFNTGLQYAAQNGWVDDDPANHACSLTVAGFIAR